MNTSTYCELSEKMNAAKKVYEALQREHASMTREIMSEVIGDKELTARQIAHRLNDTMTPSQVAHAIRYKARNIYRHKVRITSHYVECDEYGTPIPGGHVMTQTEELNVYSTHKPDYTRGW